MKPDSTSYENILEVENWGSQLSTFYKIMSPVQITLESCTGLGRNRPIQHSDVLTEWLLAT